LLDLGCANGEFLYFLADKFPKAALHGLDITQEFLSIATKLLKEKRPIKLSLGNMFSHKDNYDVVFCMGTAPIFPDPEKFITTLISMLRAGGVCIVDGLFNKHDCDVRLEFKDSSKSEDILWRTDFNIHSVKTISKIIEKFPGMEVEFHHPTFDAEIEKLESEPHVSVWTFKDQEGNNVITSGLRQVLNPSFFILRKNK
jgi:trans-aconitate methyltransferase